MNRLRAWVQYRAEKRMLERNPYDYMRFVLGMPDATDAELDAAADNMAAAIRSAGIDSSELETFTSELAAVMRLAGEPAL